MAERKAWSERVGVQRVEKVVSAEEQERLKSDPAELRREAEALKKGIVDYSQRVKALNDIERAQVKLWRERLVEIRKALGEVLSPSEERICLPANATDPEKTPSPSLLPEGFSSQAAMRIEQSDS